MSEIKHTPGPWSWDYWCLRGADKTIVLRPTTDESIYGIGPDLSLIAAAPDLLAEAKKQVAWIQWLRVEAQASLSGGLLLGIDQSIKYLTAAIAKAENA